MRRLWKKWKAYRRVNKAAGVFFYMWERALSDLPREDIKDFWEAFEIVADKTEEVLAEYKAI